MSFELFQIGLHEDILSKVCREGNIELYQCMEITTDENVESFYEDCLIYINEIFPNGSKDLKDKLGKFE